MVRTEVSPRRAARKFTVEHRANMSAASRRRWENPAEREKIGAAQRKRYEDPAEREKTGETSRGRKHTDETKEKLAAANRGRKNTAEARAKMSAVLKGRTKSAEHRAKIAVAVAGKRNGSWKGDDAGYGAIHSRADRVLPKVCAHADETCKGELQAAFIHDTPEQFVKVDLPTGCRYSTRTEDYMRLCVSHHVRYDIPPS